MAISATQLFPEVIDGSTLNERTSNSIYLPVGVEGQADSGGTATAGQLKLITRPADADTLFGAASNLAKLVKFVLDQGAGPVRAIASAKGSAPTLLQRQAAWTTLEADRAVRIRLTDSTTDADLAALGISCKNANLLNNKQIAFVGRPSATTKAALIATADAVISGDVDGAKRTVVVGPALYDANGTLVAGSYGAAAVAAMVAQNSDPADDLDTAIVPNMTGMEKDANGNDVFRMTVVSGSVVNDFEDLLQGGVSPFQPNPLGSGGISLTHLRMAYKSDSTFDSLMTRIIMDQIFVLVRDYAIRFNGLRRGNTPTTREQLRSGVDALLRTLGDWIQPVTLGDNTLGYDVVVTSPANARQQVISYRGEVVRGTQTIVVAGNLTIEA